MVQVEGTEKENRGKGMTSTRSTPAGRKFGTTLTTNAERSPYGSGISKKIVRVRRTPKSSNFNYGTPHSPIRPASRERTLLFSPGPVGLHLEKIEEDPKYGCRVVRFVDGGPKNPGQARKSGLIKPGDLVLHVEAEGIVETTYEGIIGTLKKSDVSRMIGFQSVWDENFLETQTILRFPPSGGPLATSSPSPKMSSTPESSDETSKQEELLSVSKSQAISIYSHGEEIATPRLSLTPTSTLDPNMTKSSSDLVLLTAYVPKHENATSKNHDDFPRVGSNKELKSRSFNTVELPFSSKVAPVVNEHKASSPFSVQDDVSVPHCPNIEVLTARQHTFTQNSSDEIFSQPSSKTTPEIPLQGSMIQNVGTEKSSFQSPTKTTCQKEKRSTPFSPSNVKRLLKNDKKSGSSAPQSLSRVLGSVYKNVGPVLVHSSYAIGSTVASKIVPAMAASSYGIGSAVTGKIGETLVGHSSEEFRKATEMKFELLNELSKAKYALEIQDEDKEILKQNMEALFQENVSLHTEFKQKLNCIRVHHAQTEHEMKEIYRQAQIRQDSRIRELEDCNMRLNEELVGLKLAIEHDTESRASDLERSGMRPSDQENRSGSDRHKLWKKEDLEKQILDKDTVLVSMQEDQKRMIKKMHLKEEEWHVELSDLQFENSRLQTDTMNLRMEVEMARALIKETDMRIMELESENSEMTKHLKSVQLEGSASRESFSLKLREKDEQIKSVCKELEEARDEISALNQQVKTERNQNQTNLNRLQELFCDKRSLEAELNSSEAKIESLNESVSMAQVQLKERGEDIKILRAELKDASEALNICRQENVTYQSKMEEEAAAKAEYDTAVQMLMKSVQEREQSLHESKQRVDSLRAENAQIRHELKVSYAENDDLLNFKRDKEEELEKLERRLSESRQEASQLHHNMLERIETGEAFFQGDRQPTIIEESALCLSDKFDATRSILLSSIVKIKSLENENGDLIDQVTELNKSLEDSRSRNDKYRKDICGAEAYVVALKEQVLKFRDCEGGDQNNHDGNESTSDEGSSDLKSLNPQLSWLLEELTLWLDRIKSMNAIIRQLSKENLYFEKAKSLSDTRSASLQSECDVMARKLSNTEKTLDGMQEKLRSVEDELFTRNHQADDIERAFLNRNSEANSLQTRCGEVGCVTHSHCIGAGMGFVIVSSDDLLRNLPTVLSADEAQGTNKRKDEIISPDLFNSDSLVELFEAIQSNMLLEQERAVHEIRRLDSAMELLRLDRQNLQEQIVLVNNEMLELSSTRTHDAVMYASTLDETMSERDSLLISCQQSEKNTRELRAKISTLNDDLRQSELQSSKLERRVNELTEENSKQIVLLDKKKFELRNKLDLDIKEEDGVQQAGRIKQEFRIADLKRDIESLICENEISSQDLELNDYALQSAFDDFDAAQELNILLSAESGCLYARNSALEEKLRTAENETAKLKGLVPTTQSEKRSLANKLIIEKDCSRTLESKVEVLRSHESRLEDELKASKQSLSVSLTTLKDKDCCLKEIEMENMRLKKKIFCFEIVNQRLVAEKENLEARSIVDLDSCRKQWDGLEIDLLCLQDRNRRLRKTICCLDIKNYFLVSSRQNFEKEVAAFKLNFQSKSGTVLEILGLTRSNLSRATLEINEKSGIVGALEVSRNYRNDVFRLVQLVTRLRANNVLIETQKHNCQQTNVALSFACDELRSEKEELAAILKDSEESRRIQMSMNNNLNTSLAKLQEANDETQERIRTVCCEKFVSSKQNKEMELEMSNLKESLELATLQNQKLQSTLDELRAALKFQLQDHDRSARILFQANARIVGLQVQNKKLEEENNSAELTIERIANESKVDILQRAELEHSLLNAESELLTLRKETEDIVNLETSRVKAVRRERNFLQIEIEKLQGSLKKKDSELAIRNSYFEMREKVLVENSAELRNKIKTLSSLLSEQNVEMGCLECKINDLEALCAGKSTEKSKAIHELEEIKDEIHDLKGVAETSSLRAQKMKTLLMLIQVSRNDLEDSLDEMKKTHTQHLAGLRQDHADEVKYWKEKTEEADSILSELRRELRIADEEIHQCRNIIGKMNISHKELETALIESEDTISDLRCELLNIQDELSDGQSDDDSVDSEVRRLTKGELAAECLGLQDDVAEAEAEVFKLTGEVNAQGRMLSNAEEKFRQKEIECEALLDKNTVLGDKLRQFNSQKASIEESSKQRILEIEAKLDVKTLELEQLHEKCRSEGENANRHIGGLKMAFVAVRAECVVACRELKVLKKQNHLVETQCLMVDKKYSNVERERNKLKADIAQLDSELNLKQSVICDLKDKIITLQRENAGLNSTNDILKSDCQGKDAELSVLHQSIRCLAVQNEGLKSQLQEKGSLIVGLQEMLGCLNARIDELHHGHGEQLSTIANLKLKEEGLDDKITVLSEEKDQLLLRLKSQDTVILGLKEDVRGLQDERVALSAKCDDFQKISESKASEVSLLVSRVSHLTRECELLSDTIHSLKLEDNMRKKNEEELKAFVHRFTLCLNQARADRFSDEAALGGITLEESGKWDILCSLKTKFPNSQIHKLPSNYMNSIVHGLEHCCDQGELSISSSSIMPFQNRCLIFENMRKCDDKGLQRRELARTCSTENEIDSLIFWIKESQRFFARTSVQALDLAGTSSSYDVTSTVRKKIGSLLSTAAVVRGELYLRNFKTSNSLSHSATSGDEGARNVDIAGHVDLSFYSDPPGLREVVATLEANIGRLLNHLDEANSALSDKEALFHKMERLAAQNESERVSLERKLSMLDAQVKEWKHHTYSNAIRNRELMQISCLTEPILPTTHVRCSQVAGARMLCMALEKRSRVMKSSAFRKWFCNVSTMKAIASQKRTASALAQQLEITREKLVVLKSHLRKGRHVQAGDDRKQP